MRQLSEKKSLRHEVFLDEVDDEEGQHDRDEEGKHAIKEAAQVGSHRGNGGEGVLGCKQDEEADASIDEVS